MNFNEIRQKYPEYNDMSDADFAQKFHSKFYSDMDFKAFSSKVGLQEPTQAKPEESILDKYMPEVAKGAVGTVAAGLDIAAGIPKAIVSTVAAPVRTLITGNPEESRQWAQQQAENIVGTPSKGMAGLGVPAEYLQESQPYKALMTPFEKMGQGIETAGQYVTEKTGSESAGGAAKQALDILGLALPIPGAKAAKAGVLKAFDKIETPVNVGAIRRDLGYDIPEPTTDFRKAAMEAEQIRVPSEVPVQQELDLGQVNQFGQRPSDFTVDENGIPIRQDASLEVQTTARQGDLFTPENITQQGISENVANWEQPLEARQANPDRTFSKDQEIEQAYLEKNKQDMIEQPEQLAEPSQAAVQRELPTELQGEQELFGGFDVKRTIDDLEQLYNDIKPKTLDEYVIAAKQAGLDASDDTARVMFEGLKKEKEASLVSTKETTLSNFSKKVSPKLDQYLSVMKDRTKEEAVDIIKSFPDNDKSSLGLYAETVKPKGRFGIQQHKNEGVRTGVAYMAQLYDTNRIKGNTLLNNAADGFNTVTRKLETLFGEGQAYEPIKQIFEKQANPDFQFKLNPNQTKVVETIKRINDSTWDVILEKVGQVDPKKAERLAPLKQEMYFPHSWSGDFVSYVKSPDGKMVSFIAQETMKDAKRAVETLRKDLGSKYIIDDPVFSQGRTKQLGKKAEAGKLGAQIQDARAGQLDVLLDMLGSDDPAVQKAMKDVQGVMNRRAISSEGMKQRMKVNTGVGGFQGKQSWKSDKDNYFDAKKAFQSYVENVHEWAGNMDVADFLSTIKEQAPDKANTYELLHKQFMQNLGADKVKDNPIIHEVKNTFAKSGYSPQEATKFATKVSNALTLQKLGFGNVIQFIQNTVQSPMTQAWRTADLYAHGASINPAKAAGNMLMSVWDGMTGGALHPEWAKYAKEHEIDKIGLTVFPEKTRLAAKAKEAVAWNISSSEGTSRVGYFYATTKNLMDMGYPEAKALEIAKNMTRDDMGNMERYAKPGIVTQTGIAGEALGRLQSFAALAYDQFTQSAINTGRAIKEKNPKLLVPFAAYMAGQYMMGGLNGTIPMDIAEKGHAAGVMAGIIPPEWKSPRQYVLEEQPKLAVSPFSRTMGVWVEGSFRNQVPFLNAPIVQITANSLSTIPDSVKWLASLANEKYTPSPQSKERVVEAILPTSVRGIAEQNYLRTPGGTMVSKYTGKPQYTLTEKEKGSPSIYTNLRSTQRGLTGEVTQLSNEREMRINKATKALTDEFNQSLAGVNVNQPMPEAKLTAMLKRNFELGGDPNQMLNRALTFTAQANYPSSLVVQIIKSEKNPFKQKRLMEAYQQTQQGAK